ncbi:hypothetical protein [Alteromonas sp. S015]|uniref:hypothetical protein n=1 Tax=Alteromonas sp. S015 TaxID=3117401 RepID=UPI002FDFB64B
MARGKKLFLSAILLWGKRIMLLTLMSAAIWGCSKEPPQTIHWHNAYDIERELHILGQQEDPREIYKRLQGIKQQASLQLSQMREAGIQDSLFREWLESLRISLSLAPLYGDTIETCDVWQHAMEEAWEVGIVQLNERAKLVWRVMVATCNARVRSV